jgi:Zn-dependent peptidase ImmA (M78 family)/transcriptional regulator with XRE-family HTH domain
MLPGDSIAPMESPNFRMIRLAREMRGLSQTRLAAIAKVPQANLSRIEANLRAATDEEITRLAAAVELPAGFFFEPDAPAAAPMFRKRAIRSKSVNDMIQARLNTAVLVARRIIDAGVEIDAPLAFPELDEVPVDNPAQAASMLRRAWGMPAGRVDNMTALIEAAGGIVLRVDFGTDAASAALLAPLGDARLWFVVNTQEAAGDRVRLTLAHELGHAVMHRWIPARDEKREEDHAFTFATALTLPPDEFDRSIPGDLTLSRARDLKRAYWMSIQAIVLTAHARGLITKARYQSLYRQISARGWRHDEPESIPIEEPTIWPSVLDMHRTHHRYSDDDLAAISRVTPETLAELFPESFARRLRVLPGGGAGGASPRLTIRPPSITSSA